MRERRSPRLLALAAACALVAPVSPRSAAAGDAALAPAPGRFLVARRGMADPRFRQTVILVLRYDERGALGLIVNRPTRIGLSHLLRPPSGPRSDEDAEPDSPRDPAVHVGGPVMRGIGTALIRARVAPDETSHVVEDLYMTTSRSVLEGLVSGAVESSRFRVYLGHAGWGAGQLEGELERGDWIVAAGDLDRALGRDVTGLWEALVGPPRGEDGQPLPPPGAQWTRALGGPARPRS